MTTCLQTMEKFRLQKLLYTQHNIWAKCVSESYILVITLYKVLRIIKVAMSWSKYDHIATVFLWKMTFFTQTFIEFPAVEEIDSFPFC